MTEPYNLNEVREGLTSNPKRISEIFQWTIEKAHQLYHDRKTFANIYKAELEVLSKASEKLNVHENLIVVDLCSGLSKTTPLLMKKLIETNPNRKIYFIPIDISNVIESWKSYLEENYPEVANHVVAIKPVILDVLDALRKIETFIEDTPYQKWEVLFSLFGPTTHMFEESKFQNIVKEIGRYVSSKGNGGFLLTFVQCYEEEELKMIRKDYYDVLQVPECTECILAGFNKEMDADIDPDKFEAKLEYIRNNLEEPLSMWAGFLWKIIAKEAMEINCKKLDMVVNVHNGEEIWNSEGKVTYIYYHEKYLEALARLSSMSLSQVTTMDYLKAGYISFKN